MENTLDELSQTATQMTVARGDAESQAGLKTKTPQHSASESRGTQ